VHTAGPRRRSPTARPSCSRRRPGLLTRPKLRAHRRSVPRRCRPGAMLTGPIDVTLHGDALVSASMTSTSSRSTGLRLRRARLGSARSSPTWRT
jgi:hypothetical protein